jgi:hypothetical protein
MADSPKTSTAENPVRPARARRWRAAVLVAVAVLLVAGGVAAWLYGRGGGQLPAVLGRFAPSGTDALAQSSPEERVLRTLRLAGFERAVVGRDAGVVVARIELPSVRTSADAEFCWQAGFSAMSEAFPKADRYVVQVFAPDAVPLVEVSAPGDAVRKSVGSDDATQLRAAMTVRYLSQTGGGK